MNSRITAGLTFLLLTVAALTQERSAPEPLGDFEAYRVYSVLLPKEESYARAKGTLVIQEETVSDKDIESCLTDAVKIRFKDALEDFNRANAKQWRLQRQFTIEKPYEIVSRETINVHFKEGASAGKDGWFDGYYRRYAGSGGITVMSAVGFNRDKSLAVVYSGSSCASLCGDWSFHLLERNRGQWKEVPGVMCHTVS